MISRRQLRSTKVNFLKFRLMGSIRTFSDMSRSSDLPENIRILAGRVKIDIDEMLKDWPKHLPREELK